MLSVQEEVYRDKVVVVGRRFHVKDKAMDAVLDERPQEPAQQKEQREAVLVDRDGDAWQQRERRRCTHASGGRERDNEVGFCVSAGK